MKLELFGKKLIGFTRDEQHLDAITSAQKGNITSTTISNKLSKQEMEDLALAVPFFMKGAIKKNRDVLRSGFVLVTEDGDQIEKSHKTLFNTFMENTDLLNKFNIASVCSDIFGDGYIARTFKDDYDDNGKLIEGWMYDAPNLDEQPIDLINIDSKMIHSYEQKDKRKGGKFFYKTESREYIYPERLVHVKTLSLPHRIFGISKVVLGRYILHTSWNTDIITGEVMDWFSSGILHDKITGMTTTQQEDMVKQMSEHPRYYVTDEYHNLSVHNPTHINPEPFYNHIYATVAALFNMPQHVLVGSEPGYGGGGESGTLDYYNDCVSQQELIYTPLIKPLLRQLFESSGYVYKYRIDWSQKFVDELSEGKIGEKRMLVASTGYNSGLLTDVEARRIFNQGMYNLNPVKPEGELKEKETPVVGSRSLNPPNKDDTVSPNKDKVVVPKERGVHE